MSWRVWLQAPRLRRRGRSSPRSRSASSGNIPDSRDWGVNVIPLHEATVKDVRLRLLVLFGSVGIPLLIACANVANLLLSRAVTRRAEMAIRISLGATGGRLVRQFLTESLVLAASGGVLGVLLAVWGTDLVVSVLPAALDLPRTREIGVDLRILGFAFAVTIVTAIMCLFPSENTIRSAPQSGLRTRHADSTAGRSRSRVTSALIISEVALALILLAGAGLLGRSFWELRHVNPGFRTEEVLTMRTTLPASPYDTDDRVRAFGLELLYRIGNLPGMRAAGAANYLPMTSEGVGGPFEILGRPVPPEQRPGSWVTVVGGRYFEAMGIPLLRGCLFSSADTKDSQPVFVIDEELARQRWSGEDPIGARVAWTMRGGERRVGEIIGVVGSVRFGGMASTPPATTYFWFPRDRIANSRSWRARSESPARDGQAHRVAGA